MGKLLKILLLSILLTSCDPSNMKMEEKGNIEVIGYYSNRTNSMCSQNCESINIGPFELTTTLSGINEYEPNKLVYIEGKIIKTKELPTVAGPGAQPSKKLQNVNKIKTEFFKLIEESKFSISKSELTKYVSNQESEINMIFTNPIDQDLSLKLIIEDGLAQKFNIKAKETKEITAKIQVNNNPKIKRYKDSYIDFLIINDWAKGKSDYRKINNNYDKFADQTVVFIDGAVSLEEIVE